MKRRERERKREHLPQYLQWLLDQTEKLALNPGLTRVAGTQELEPPPRSPRVPVNRKCNGADGWDFTWVL